MAKEIIKEWKGLNTAASYAALEPGYLAVCDNCVILEPSLIEPRPGFSAIAMPAAVSAVTACATFNNSPAPNGNGIIIVGTNTAGIGSFYTWNGSSWVQGTATGAWLQAANLAPPPGWQFNRFQSASGSTYFTSATGLMKMDTQPSATMTALMAGQADPPNFAVSLGVTSGPFLNSNSSVAYRGTFSKYDHNGLLIESSPSARAVITNPPNAGLTASIGSGATFSVSVNATTGAVTGVTILSGGSLYTASSVGTFTGAGSGATCTFTVANGAIIGVTVTAPGAGYVQQLNARPSILLPTDATLNTIVNFYRSPQVDQSFGTVSPSDLLYKIGQRYLVAGDLAVGYVVWNDIQPDALLYQSPFYVNTLALGIEEEYDQPQLGNDVANFRNRLWTCNTRIPNYITTTYIGGLQLGDTVTVNGIPFSVVTSNVTGQPNFQLVSSGSIAYNIEQSMRNLCSAVGEYFYPGPVNGNPAVLGYNQGKTECSYTSGFNGAPGNITFSEIGIGGQAFTVSCSRSGCFVPDMPTSQPLVSVNEALPNRVYYSEDGLPDAMPVASNFLDVGTTDKPIFRMVLIGQTLFVFKTDGLYKITGFTPNDFAVSQVNPELRIINPQCLCVISNTIFCLTRQGIHAVTEAGAVLLSRPIDDKIKALVGVINSNPNAANQPFMIGNEAKHYVLMACPASVADPYCSLQICYCLANNSFTTWSLPNLYYGFTDINSQVFLFQHDPFQGHRMLVERTTGTYLDYQDPGFTLTNPLLAPNCVSTLTFSSEPGLNVGDVLFQSSTGSYATVLNVIDLGTNNPRNNIIVLDELYNLDTTNLQVLQSIQSQVQPQPFRGGDDSQITAWKTAYVRFNRNDGLLVTASAWTEIMTTATVDQRFLAEGNDSIAYGSVPFGQQSFGGRTANNKLVMQVSAPEHGESAILNLNFTVGNACQPWSMGTVSVLFNPVTDELRK